MVGVTSVVPPSVVPSPDPVPSPFVPFAPGVVVVYDRNTVTNKILEEYGLRLIKIRGSELVRGRGGPRCMSMPFEREEI